MCKRFHFQILAITICVICTVITSYKVSRIFNNSECNQIEIVNNVSSSDNEDIVNAIRGISNELSKNDYFSSVFPWVLSTITSLIAYFASYYITKKSNEKDFQRECTFDYLKYLNNFLKDINVVYTTMYNIAKLSQIFKNRMIIPTGYYFDCNSDYKSFVDSMNLIERYVNSSSNCDKKNKELWNEYYSHLTNYNLFIDICTNFESNVCHYYYVIDKRIFEGHKKLINEIRMYTRKKMEDFYPFEYKKKILSFIKLVNEFAMGQKYELLDFDNYNNI